MMRLICLILLAALAAIPGHAMAQGGGGGAPVVLFGERVNWSGRPNAEPQPGEAAETAGKALRMAVRDLTTTSALAGDLLDRVDAALELEPKVILIFTGRSDEREKTPDDRHMAALTTVLRRLTVNGAAVFLVPSRPTLTAATSANLRIAATSANVSYVEPGTRLGQRPYDDALATVRLEFESLQRRRAERARVMPDAPPAGTARTTSTETASGPVPIYMPAPPGLRQFDPQESMKPRAEPRRRGRAKAPAFDREPLL